MPMAASFIDPLEEHRRLEDLSKHSQKEWMKKAGQEMQ